MGIRPDIANITSAGGTGSNVVITKPTGTVAGKVLAAHVVVENSASITPVAGGGTWALANSFTAGGIRSSVYTKVCTGAEPAIYQFNFNSSQQYEAYVVPILGASQASLVTAVTGASFMAAGTSIGLATLTAALNGSLELFFAATAFGTTYTKPSGFDDVYAHQSGSGSGHISLGLFSRYLAASGATGGVTATQAANTTRVGHHLILRPTTRSVPLSIHLVDAVDTTFERLVPISAVLMKHVEKEVPLSAVLTFKGERSVPLSAALTFQGQNTVPLSAALVKHVEKEVPLTAALMKQVQLEVPLSAAIVFQGQRTVPLSLVLTEEGQTHFELEVPLTAVLMRHLEREVPLSLAVYRHAERTVPLSAALAFQGQRLVPLTAALAYRPQHMVPLSAVLRSTRQRLVPLSIHLIEEGVEPEEVPSLPFSSAITSVAGPSSTITGGAPTSDTTY